jgi:4-pyridoxate dehydrogenase
VRGRTVDPIYQAWIEAAQACGHPINDDHSSGNTEGFGPTQLTVRKGRRASAARAYLKPARSRSNLTVITRALTTRVIIERGRATGVEYVRHSRNVRRAHVEREVILSGGTYNTPHLLMLSGIGPAAHLCEHGIDVIADLPVGRNLQDHLAVSIFYRRKDPGEFLQQMRFDRMAFNMLRAYLLGTGFATALPGGVFGFLKSRPELAVPDLEFMLPVFPPTAHLWFPGVKQPYADGFGIRPAILHPESRGTVMLRSPDPRDPVRINFNFFSAPGDLVTLRQGVKMAREIAQQKALDSYRGPEIIPGDEVTSDEAIDAHIRRTTGTVSHPACTCPIGLAPENVLDPELRVRGVEKLRVVDASAMPDLTTGHINACVLMMAERASDLIRGHVPLPPVTTEQVW